MTNDNQDDSKDKKPRDKSISLKPLNLKEALANLLAVKPKPKEEEAEAKKEEPEE